MIQEHSDANGKTILVTGGAGFIGANFVHYARRALGLRVVNLDKLTYAGNLGSLADLEDDPEHVFVVGDIGDADTVRGLLHTHRPFAILNFAAESHVDRSILGPAPFIETNVMGTFVMLQEALAYRDSLKGEERDTFRMLHVSTDEVYGSLAPGDPAFTEKHQYAPNSPYAASKAAADHLVRSYHRTYGLPVVTTNCSNNYGPYQHPEKLIPLMIHHALEGKPLPVYGDGMQVRDWLYVADHCEALWRVVQAGTPGETYNIGGHNEMPNIEVVRRICAILARWVPDSPHAPFDTLITHVKDRPGHDRRYAIDSAKIGRELGWSPRETFDTGLDKTVRWYLDHVDWVVKARGTSYDTWMAQNYQERLKERR